MGRSKKSWGFSDAEPQGHAFWRWAAKVYSDEVWFKTEPGEGGLENSPASSKRVKLFLGRKGQNGCAEAFGEIKKPGKRGRGKYPSRNL